MPYIKRYHNCSFPFGWGYSIGDVYECDVCKRHWRYTGFKSGWRMTFISRLKKRPRTI